jgi:hypothetical protein
MPGGPAALDQADKPDRDRCARCAARERGGAALAVQVGPVAVELPSTLLVERRRTIAGEHSGHGPQRRASVEKQQAPCHR